MESNNDKEFVLANIPSVKPYYINKSGEMIGANGRILKAGLNHKKTNIAFRNEKGVLQQMSLLKIILLTFSPEYVMGENDAFTLIDENAENKFHPSNILKFSRKDLINKMQKMRALSTERDQVVAFIKENGTATKQQLFEVLKLEERKNGWQILGNLIVRMFKENKIASASHGVYKLPEEV